MNIACVIGNGNSRKIFDLERIGNHMTTYGCNALYRDYIPNYLISMDILMVCEIIENDIHRQTKFYTQHTNKMDQLAEDGEPINFFWGERETKDSGNSAVKLASKNNDIVYMIGFDYSIEGKLSNIYLNTKNYAKNENKPACDFQDTKWKQTLGGIIRNNPATKFIRVNGNNNPLSITNDNYQEITIEQFKELYE